MTTPLSPESAKSWFNTFYAVTEKSTPITMVFIMLFMIFGYVVTKREFYRLHDVNQTLWTRVTDQTNQLIQLALDCGKKQ